MPKKKHWVTAVGKRASCGKWVNDDSQVLTTVDDFWAADVAGTLCKLCLRSATNESSPY